MANIKKTTVPEQEEIKLSRAEQFYNSYKKYLWGAGLVVVLVGAIALAYNKFVYQPQCAEAMSQAFPAENNFQNGEFELALKGDGNVLGFEQIIEEYGTKAGKDVYLYAGICEYQIGQYDSCLVYLKNYSGKDEILSARAKCTMGDAYVGLEQYEKAIACYKDAAAIQDNVFVATYLVKEGLAHEKLGDKASALKCYIKVRDFYPNSIEGYDIAKNIARVEE